MSAALIPHSFVLADLFDVLGMSLEIPDHVLEDEPCLELVPCPECEGEGWLEAHGSAWGASCAAWGRPDLNFVLKPCLRCHGEGEVLGWLEPTPLTAAGPECDRCQDMGWALPSLPLRPALKTFVTCWARACARVALGVTPWSRRRDEPLELSHRACRSNNRVSSPAARALELRPEAESFSEGDGFTVDPHPGLSSPPNPPLPSRANPQLFKLELTCARTVVSPKPPAPRSIGRGGANPLEGKAKVAEETSCEATAAGLLMVV